MSDQFLAEIRVVPFNFAPNGWALCDGQLMAISSNTALFSLLGTTYGGDGRSTFALPNLQGSVPLHVGGSGPGPGLAVYDLGEQSGETAVALLQSELPVHNHQIATSTARATSNIPGPAVGLARSIGDSTYASTPTSTTQMGTGAATAAGAGVPHNNLMPYLTLNFVIALTGIYPSRP